MKQPPPAPPNDLPPGTRQLGGPLGWFSASFHVTADDLLPEEITHLLGREPTESQTKGVPILRPDGTIKRTPKFGRWSITLKPAATDEWDINEVIVELLASLPTSPSVWESVAIFGRIQISLGLELKGGNQEFALEPDLLYMLGERKILVYFDVYRRDEVQP